MLVCPIRKFRILRRLEIVKYVKYMLAGGRHVRKWTHKAKMAGLFVFITCATEPIVEFVLHMFDQSATRNATLTNLTCALPFTYRFFFCGYRRVSDS